MQPTSAMKESNGQKLKLASNYDDLLVAVLPPEIWELIILKLDIADYHCFGAVCKSWRSMAIFAKQNQNFCFQQLPWLMLSSCNDSLKDGHHGFFSLSHGKVFKLKLPEDYGDRCCGSSGGWLIMENWSSGENFLLNPISRSRIQLPSQFLVSPFGDIRDLFGPKYARKAILMSPPANPPTASCMRDRDSDTEVANNDCVVASIYAYGSLCFCRPGDQVWTHVGKMHSITPFLFYSDIILYNDQLYGITLHYDLVLVELGPHQKETSLNISRPEGCDSFTQKGCQFIYLVESCGELLMVVRHWHHRYDIYFSEYLTSAKTTTFEVFKLNPSGRCWIKVDSLGDQILFVGISGGISLSAKHFSGFVGNCIYFTDDSFSPLALLNDGPQICHDLGVFSFKDGSIKSFFPADSTSSMFPLVWFMPGPF